MNREDIIKKSIKIKNLYLVHAKTEDSFVKTHIGVVDNNTTKFYDICEDKTYDINKKGKIIGIEQYGDLQPMDYIWGFEEDIVLASMLTYSKHHEGPYKYYLGIKQKLNDFFTYHNHTYVETIIPVKKIIKITNKFNKQRLEKFNRRKKTNEKLQMQNQKEKELEKKKTIEKI